MKKCLLSACATLTIALFNNGNTQTVSDFDNLTLDIDTFWNGSDETGGFASGDAYFSNFWDTAFGGYWASGWTYSNKLDTVNAFPNIFSASTGVDFSGNANYAIGMPGSVIQLTGVALNNEVSGLYVTNSSYAYISMRDGDQFAKQFGGTSGDDPDWFRLTVKGYTGGNLTTDSVDFYLADYRFTDNDSDYIVTSWEWIDLTSLGNIDSVWFTLNSSDTGQFGMNTPGFFCIDNFNGIPASVAHTNTDLDFAFFPNPATESVYFNTNIAGLAEVYDINGRVQKSVTINETKQQISIADIAPGIYFVKFISLEGEEITNKLIKR